MKKLLAMICLCAALAPSLCHAKGLAVWADANYIKHPVKGYYRFIISEGDDFTDAQRQSLSWALFKQNRNPVIYEETSPKFANESAMQGVWCAEWNLIKGDIYRLSNPTESATMFRGYNIQPTVLLCDDEFINTHTFPAFNRWMSGEVKRMMPAAFVTKMRKRYGRKVYASYEAASLRGANGVLAVTDFGVVNNNNALVVYTWLENGKEVCSYELRQDDVTPEQNVYGLWSLGDDGLYGLPEVTTIARDKATGNIEFFVCRGGEESCMRIHFAQKGNKLEMVENSAQYVWVDTKSISQESLNNPVLDEKDNFTTGLEWVSQGTDDDNGYEYRYADFDLTGGVAYGEVEGSLYCVWNFANDCHDNSDPTFAWSETRPDGSTWERDFGSERVVAGRHDFDGDGVDEVVVCKRWYDEAHKKSGVGIAVVFPNDGYAKFHYLSQGSCCVQGDAKVVVDGKSIVIDHNNGHYSKWTWNGFKFADQSK